MRRFLLNLWVSLSLAGTCWAGASRDFDGVNDNVLIANESTFDIDDNLTISLWFLTDSLTGFRTIIQKRNDTCTTSTFLINFDNTPSNVLQFGGCTSAGFFGVSPAWTTNFSTGTWYNLTGTMTQNGGNVDVVLYKNGVSLAAASPTVDWTNGLNDVGIRIGTLEGLGEDYDGQVAYVQIWRRVLSSPEIFQAMYQPCSVPTNLLLCAPLLGDATEPDWSGNGNTGTVSGSIASSLGPPVYLTSPLATWRRFWQTLAAWMIPNVYADDVITCAPTDPTVPNRVIGYERHTDPVKSGAINDPNTLIYTDPMTNSPRPWNGVVPPGASTYWKCSGNQVVAMSQVEQDAVDAPALADAALHASYDTEVASNNLCTATLAEIDSRIDTEKAAIDTTITSASNVAGVKTAMLNANARYAAAFKKVARCIKSRLR